MFVLSCSSRTTFVNFWTLLTFVKFSLTLWVELMAISIFCSVTWQLYNKVSFFHNADCKFWPHKELPGFGGDVHYPDDAAFSNWGAQSDNRPLQLCPRNDTRFKVIHMKAASHVEPQTSEVMYCVMFLVQWSRISQAWTDDCGLWEPTEKDDGGVCPSCKSKICYNERNPMTVSHLKWRTCFNPSSLAFSAYFSLFFGSRCKMHWSPCRWCTHAGICLQISGGTLSCSVWLVLPVPCSIQLSQTRSGFTVVLKYYCKVKNLQS